MSREQIFHELLVNPLPDAEQITNSIKNLGNTIIEYAGKKYAAYKKSSNPVEFIQGTTRLVKVLQSIHNAIKRADPQSLEINLEDEEWIVQYKAKLLEILRRDTKRDEEKNRISLDRYCPFLINKKACWLCKSPDEAYPGEIYYSPHNKYLYIVNPAKIDLFMVYKDFPEKIFWLKENIKQAEVEFNTKQVKMYGQNAKDWKGNPLPKSFINKILGVMQTPGATGGTPGQVTKSAATPEQQTGQVAQVG